MVPYYEIFGYLGGLSLAICFLPQSIQTLRTKNVRGLSAISYSIYTFGMVCWTLYGIYLNSLPMMIFNSISCIFSVIILYTIIKERGKK